MLDSKAVIRHSGFAVLAAALVALAFANRLTVDDAYIYYRYAQHWIEGLGLVWNPGEPVEGFTSLPWLAWVVACRLAGVDPALTGLAFFGGALVLLYAAALRAAGSAAFALAAVAVYGTNYTVSSFATGGLETSLHLMLLLAALACFVRMMDDPHLPAKWAAALSVALGLAFAIRMDSALFAIALLTAAAWRAGRPRLLPLTVPAATLALAFLVARLLLVGELLPNTFHVKLGGARDLGRGFDYAALFHHDYLLHVALIPAVIGGWTIARKGRASALALCGIAATWALWCGYVIWLGGDFMEFRMMTPALAPLLVAIAIVWREAAPMRPLLWAALVVVGLQNLAVQLEMRRAERAPFTAVLHHNRFPFYLIPPEADSVPMLRAHLEHPQDDWIGVGRRLGEVFDHSPEVWIATTAAGAIPYFSRLPTIDMLGLNDRWVAREGRPLTTRPGHARGATTGYLLERGVDLVIAHPVMLPREKLPQALATVPPTRFWFDRAPAGSRLIALPVNESHALVMLYLGRDPVIDAAIAREGLLVLRQAEAGE